MDRIGKVWASPATAFGIGFGTTLTLIDIFNGGGMPSITSQYNAINFITNFSSVPIFDCAAITFGNIVAYGNRGKGTDKMVKRYNLSGSKVQIGLHESAHTYQWQTLGLFFLPIYFGTGAWNSPNHSFLEDTADNYAESGGWWL